LWLRVVEAVVVDMVVEVAQVAIKPLLVLLLYL
jgi:hypothetical protein